MPIYEYSCVECQEQFQLMRPMCDSAKSARCPECGKTAHRAISVFASKADYTIKVPTKDAFRGAVPARKKAAARAKPKAGKK